MVKKVSNSSLSDEEILEQAGLKIENDRFYSLNVSLNFINDNDERSSVSSHCICVSKNKSNLQHYADVLNEANSIRLKICPRNVLAEHYEVRLIEYI